jgi:hypothetical protein
MLIYHEMTLIREKSALHCIVAFCFYFSHFGCLLLVGLLVGPSTIRLSLFLLRMGIKGALFSCC